MLLLVLFSVAHPLGLSSRAADPLTFAEFERLPAAKQETRLRTLFRERLEHSQNISFRSTTRSRNHEINHRVLGDAVNGEFKWDFHQKRLQNKYLLETKYYGSRPTAVPYEVLAFSFDFSDGITEFEIARSDAGRTEITRPLFIDSNRFCSWLAGDWSHSYESHFDNLVNVADDCALQLFHDRGLVKLTIPWTPFDGASGSWEYLLDPQKGFMPIHGRGRWDRTRDGKADSWRDEEFEVSSSVLVAEVWMPTSIREVIVASTLGHKIANVHLVTVSDIECGRVTFDDLEID